MAEFSDSLPPIGRTPLPKKPFGDAYANALENSSIQLDDTWNESLESPQHTDSAWWEDRPQQGSTSATSLAASSQSCSIGLRTYTRSKKSLEAARNYGRWRLLRLRGPTLTLGSLCICAGFFVRWLRSHAQGETAALLTSISACLLYLGSTMFILSLLPSDKRCVPLSILSVAFPTVALQMGSCMLIVIRDHRMISSGRCSYNELPRPCWFTVVTMLGELVIALTSLVMLSVFSFALRKATTESLLFTTWRSVAGLYFLICLVTISRCFACATLGQYVEAATFALNFVVSAASFWFALQYKVIRQIQSWLMSRGQAATAAAVISELLGGQNPENVLEEARTTFSSVRADKVTQDAMRKHDPDPSLSALARKTSLGHVDAFVSHSWHDDSDMKWHELQKWRAEFKELHKREPNLWIDKYCIDQRNIEKSLACLPVYLSGCTKLVVLCGKSYLKRLWCLIEIFVFMEMGGKLENLDVRLLGIGLGDTIRTSTKASIAIASSESLAAELVQFDSLNAQCTNEDDTMRLQGVIQVAGSSKIDNLVRDAFVRQLEC